MYNLKRAINLLSDKSEFREFIREELPEPRPSKRWFTQQMNRLKRDHPDMPSLERSRKVKDMWYGLPGHEQKKLRKQPLEIERRK